MEFNVKLDKIIQLILQTQQTQLIPQITQIPQIPQMYLITQINPLMINLLQSP